MTDLLKNRSDRALMFKSVLIACGIAALLLTGLHHKTPATSSDRSDGGRVFLLLPSKGDEGDRAAFVRWRELNLPSHIFGYDSSGLFAALFPRKSREAAPPVFSSRPVSSYTPLLALPEFSVPRTAAEPASSEMPLPRLGHSGAEHVPLTSGAVVYDEAGKVRLRLPDLRGVELRAPLMLRAGKALAGTEFRIVGSSGNSAFDRSVLKELEQRVRQGESFSGILTVWGDGRGTK